MSRARLGVVLLALALVGSVAFSLVPAPYVIEQPGPVFNTLGEVTIGKTKVPMISIPGEKTYPTSGSLDLLTVSIVGNPDQLPNWFDVLSAWFNPSEAVVPLHSVFPAGTTVKQSDEQAAAEMTNSQDAAIAAALRHLGKPVTGVVSIAALTEHSPAAGILKPGDKIVQVAGKAVQSVEALKEGIAASGAGRPLSLQIDRGGATKAVTVVPQQGGAGSAPVIGVEVRVDYTLPFEVKIQLDDVGGPSAGQMFALGIIDKLTPGSLTGGAKVAGTGEVDPSGTVGVIGGIRQKLYGARQAGATWFLAPYGNCDEVRGHVPSGLTVLAVRNLGDSLKALQAISTGGSTAGLLTCSAK
jgi:PDZ domain-containing protein